jgi:hypothetical protein
MSNQNTVIYFVLTEFNIILQVKNYNRMNYLKIIECIIGTEKDKITKKHSVENKTQIIQHVLQSP